MVWMEVIYGDNRKAVARIEDDGRLTVSDYSQPLTEPAWLAKTEHRPGRELRLEDIPEPCQALLRAALNGAQIRRLP